VISLNDTQEEVRFVKLEMTQLAHSERLSGLDAKLKSLESNHSEQVGILARLKQTVDTLADTVITLSELTKDLDKNQEVFTARFNLIVAILTTIGVAVVAGVVKLLFFTGQG
jgi:hypothetical protein